jgi:hypothetical protein
MIDESSDGRFIELRYPEPFESVVSPEITGDLKSGRVLGW